MATPCEDQQGWFEIRHFWLTTGGKNVWCLLNPARSFPAERGKKWADGVQTIWAPQQGCLALQSALQQSPRYEGLFLMKSFSLCHQCCLGGKGSTCWMYNPLQKTPVVKAKGTPLITKGTPPIAKTPLPAKIENVDSPVTRTRFAAKTPK